MSGQGTPPSLLFVYLETQGNFEFKIGRFEDILTYYHGQASQFVSIHFIFCKYGTKPPSSDMLTSVKTENHETMVRKRSKCSGKW